MDARWRGYIRFHLSFLLFAAVFAVWATAMRYFFPEGYFDCLLNDFLHLYCPLCGGTRAFLALLRLDPFAAFHYNAGVLLLVPVAAFLEVRALVILFGKKEKALFPVSARRFAVVYLIVYGVLRNTALLFGFDLLRDQTAFWQARITPLRAACFLPLAALLCACFWLICFPQKRLARVQFAFVCVAALLPLLILAMLYGNAWLLLPEPLIAAVLAVYKLCKKSREKGEKIC